MANFFPRWTNFLPLKIFVCLFVLGGVVSFAMNYYFTPKYSRVGYQPVQPIPFDHGLHAGQLGLDCRYCHSFVEQSGHSNVPSSETCWNCHEHVKPNSPKLAALRESIETGKPIEWVQIHRPPDYVYFNHAVHINRGISCKSCHGAVNEMQVVHHAEPHSMSWCLDCHRNPENHLRPLDAVFNLDWKAEDYVHPDGKKYTQKELGEILKKHRGINPPEDCAACHR